jgi:hypothetical protein
LERYHRLPLRPAVVPRHDPRAARSHCPVSSDACWCSIIRNLCEAGQPEGVYRAGMEGYGG